MLDIHLLGSPEVVVVGCGALAPMLLMNLTIDHSYFHRQISLEPCRYNHNKLFDDVMEVEENDILKLLGPPGFLPLRL